MKKRISAGHALSPTSMALTITNLDNESPASTLLIYDEKGGVLWGHAKIPRVLVSVSHVKSPTSQKNIYVAMSNEGDVYFAEGKVPRERILGAGVLSEDSKGYGSMRKIRNFYDTLYACGYGAQIYSRDKGGEWSCLASKDSLGDLRFEDMAAWDNGKSIAACGFTNLVKSEIDEETKIKMEALRANGDLAAYRKMLRESKKPAQRPKGCVYVRQSGFWKKHEVSTGNYLYALDFNGKLMAMGSGGKTVVGEDDFSESVTFDSSETFRDISSSGEKTYILGEQKIYVTDQSLKLLDTIDVPASLGGSVSFQMVEDVGWYFGDQGAGRWKKTWEILDVPKEHL